MFIFRAPSLLSSYSVDQLTSAHLLSLIVLAAAALDRGVDALQICLRRDQTPLNSVLGELGDGPQSEFAHDVLPVHSDGTLGDM